MGTEHYFVPADEQTPPKLTALTAALKKGGIVHSVDSAEGESEIVLDPGAAELGVLYCNHDPATRELGFVTFDASADADAKRIAMVLGILAKVGLVAEDAA